MMRAALSVLAILLAVIGCKKGPEIVGRWAATSGGKSIEIEFKPDDTYTIGTSRIKAKGQYKRDGDKLALTPQDVELPGMPAGMAEKAKAMPSFGQTTNATIQFTGEDELSISGLPGTPKSTAPRPAVTLKRVKG